MSRLIGVYAGCLVISVFKSRCGSFVIQVAAEAENNDNELEQRRQHGKRVRYGEVVQVVQ